MIDPQIWWYVTRASALIAWVLLVVSVMWGILLSTRVLKPKDSPGWLLDLHRWMSSLAVVFTGLHMFSLYMDHYAHFSPADLFIPFHSQYTKIESLGPLPIALGVLCFYLLIAVQATSLILKILPRKFWKAVHYLSYAVVILISFHAGWSGTDTRAWMYRIVAILLIMLTTVALIVRILFPKSAKSLAATVEQRRPGQNEEVKNAMVVDKAIETATGIRLIEFIDPTRLQLPAWLPGSHITLHLPNGLKRQYSLCGDPADRTRYQIAVLNSPTSRGGSKWIHDEISRGIAIEISGPHNHFELEPSPEYVFVAGGIGITPIKSMLESLPPRRNWKLLYAGRSRASMAFVDELTAQYPDRVTIHADDERGGPPDLDAFLVNSTAQVYVCGPEPLLNALIEKVPTERLHFERFNAVKRESNSELTEYEVTLERSNKKFMAKSDESLLDSINRNGGAVISSCGEGVCGTCEVRILNGKALHLDSVMSDADKDEISVMYPCVSKSATTKLVLDI
jgi:ferredoxin-NADP reductase/DMSO/TMAO reductase YedYZ heme-binding membrane subunit